MKVLITGAGRGLGLEFARQYSARGEQIFATVRDKNRAGELTALPGVQVFSLDAANPGSIRELRKQIEGGTDRLDLLINNAGIWSTHPGKTSEKLGNLTVEDATGVLLTNAVAPLLISQEFAELLARGENPRIVSISSGYGSLSANTGFPYHYSASKAALNQYMRSLAAETKDRGIIVAVLTPGWVRTDMGGPNATLSPEESVSGMVNVIDRLKLSSTGQWFDYHGAIQNW